MSDQLAPERIKVVFGIENDVVSPPERPDDLIGAEAEYVLAEAQPPDQQLRDTKTCRRCGETKPLEDFHRRSKSSDGREARCAVCRRETHDREWNRASYQRNIEKERARHRERAKGKQPKRIPEHEEARRQLRNAVKRGDVVKPDRCDECREPLEAKLLHGHHADYALPFEVTWLCARCHGLQHRKGDDDA